ncbi:XRE family transcriptional regulator [Bradyrhizobium sp. SZCCHNR1083]|nr:XRE family transcriptional regulator [Bradyrhizobium sp. SZCCHNR1083]
MTRTPKELERVFGKSSKGATEEERAATSEKLFVRSQVQIAEDSESAKGHRLSAQEALRLFGFDLLARVAEEGSAPLVTKPSEPAATLMARRVAFGLTPAQVARKAGISEMQVQRAELTGSLSPIRDLERIAQALALNELTLGYESGARGNEALGVRLREFAELKDTRRFSPSDVMALAEAAWVIRTQSDLSRLLGKRASLPDIGFKPDNNYAFPAYERGYKLAEATRMLLNIGLNEPILSIKSLVEETLSIPVIQQALAPKFAGATMADRSDRGIVVNEAGQNSNVWVRRMTMAHELGHLLWDPDTRLDTLKVDKYDDVEARYFKASTRDPVEIRTNAFAISFLAPPGAVRSIVAGRRDLVDALGEVMTTFGVGATAAKFHVGNVCNVDTSRVSVAYLPKAEDDWIGRENLTVDWFPLKSTPISRRGRFALLVARSFQNRLISADTAAMHLHCTANEFLASVDAIVSAF